MWFILALLFFAFAYQAWRRIQPKANQAPRPFPKNAVIFAFALLLGAGSFAVRLVFPMGYYSPLFSFQYCFFAQYIALFIVGLIAFRSNWLMTIPKETGKLWSKIAVALVAVYAVIFIPTILTGGLILNFRRSPLASSRLRVLGATLRHRSHDKPNSLVQRTRKLPKHES